MNTKWPNKVTVTLVMLILLAAVLLAREVYRLTQAATTTAGMGTPAPTSMRAVVSGGPVYWGASLPDAPWDMTKQAQFESMTRKGASIIQWGQPWQIGGVFQPFYAGDFDTARNHGSIPMIDWGSWNLGSGVNQPDFQLSDITAGTYDSYIASWATGARNWGKPLFLRFNWEMNGSWFPWGVQANGNQTRDYVPAWRHVHDIFTSVGANNVSWVWSANIVSNKLAPIRSLYPGDAYVDWVGMDGYNWAEDLSMPWLSFSQVFQTTYNALVSLAPAKPIMIAETATSDNGGPLGYPHDKANWIRDALVSQLPVNFPKVKALVWFNWHDDDNAVDWRIQTSQQAIDAFARGIESGYYASNNYANLSTLP
ncbi:MAG: hypothetical protein HYX94_12010 [Chloroflexi bacterium]|nr:hypothetical protein [Chloroflexota bacterium]